jgi:CRISPR-associated protein Cas1
VREVLLFKLESQAALLRALLNTKKDLHKELTNAIDIAINIIHNTANKIRTIEDTNLNAIAPTLRGWEGTASKAYFGVLGKMLPEPYSFTKRSKHPAKDPFNAMINYLYGMLYSRVEGDLILAGIDPYLGIFHSDMHKRPVLAYDFIELWRTWADNVALKIFFADLIDDACFETDNTTGAVWLLGPGKQIAATAFNEYLSQVIDLNGNRRSRREHIRLYTQHFATKLKELPDEDPDSTTI